MTKLILIIEGITGLSSIITMIYTIYRIREIRHRLHITIKEEKETNKIIRISIDEILKYNGNYEKINKKIKEDEKKEEGHWCLIPLIGNFFYGFYQMMKDFLSFSSLGFFEISPRTTFSIDELKFLRKKLLIIKVTSLVLFIIVSINLFYIIPEDLNTWPFPSKYSEYLQIGTALILALFIVYFLLPILRYLVDKSIE